MSTTQGIKLDDEISARLKALGKKRDRSPHWLMKTAIEIYLDREEKYEAEKAEDMARWEQYQLTGKAIDNSKVEAWLKDLSQGKNTPWPQ
jgi:predicted transcriptional regulator